MSPPLIGGIEPHRAMLIRHNSFNLGGLVLSRLGCHCCTATYERSIGETEVVSYLFFRELYGTKNRDRMNIGLCASLI